MTHSREAETAFLVDIGARIEELRSARGLSLVALARIARVPPGTIRAIELGRQQAGVVQLRRLASALGRPMVDLLPAHGPG